MKNKHFYLVLSLLILLGFIFPLSFVNAQGVLCGSNDTFMTTSIVIKTGINYKISDSTHYTCGYGGNTNYTSVNNNVDSFWIVSHLSTMYNPRANSSPFAYTGRYLVPGDNPYILCTIGNPVQSFWSDFTSGGGCSTTPTTANATQWLSIYSDGGGQDVNGFDTLYNGYEFDRCFALCQQDSVNVSLQMMADDIIDTIMIDTTHIYITPASTNMVKEEFKCDSILSVNKKIHLAAGRHFFRIWARDIFHGHLGLNVYGSITATAKNLIKPKYDDKCTLTYTSQPYLGVTSSSQVQNDVAISPNPNNGTFHISIPANKIGFHLIVFDCFGRTCIEQNLTNTESTIVMNNYAAGIYFLRLTSDNEIINKRIIIQ